MPIQTRNLFSRQEGPPDVQAAEYQLALARAMQQQAMRPNVPLAGGPVQATYGVGQGLVDLATALTSAYNVKKSEGAYKRAQEAQAAQAQAQQRQALDAMLGGQNAGDGMGPPTPTPGYEQTIGLAQGAINAGVSPELAKALLEARKPKEQEGYTLASGARRYGPEGRMVAENPAPKEARVNPDIERLQYLLQHPEAAALERNLRASGASSVNVNTGGEMPKPPPGFYRPDAKQPGLQREPGGPEVLQDPKLLWDTYSAARKNMATALAGATTAPGMGVLPPMTAKQQIAQGGVGAMAPVLKQLFRAAGEGTFTNQDQKLLMDMVPSRNTLPEAREVQLRAIDSIVRAKLGLPPDTEGWSVEPVP